MSPPLDGKAFSLNYVDQLSHFMMRPHRKM